MASSSSRGPLTALIVIVAAAAAGGAGYYFGAQSGGVGSSPSGMSAPAAPSGSAVGKGAVVAKVDGSPIYQSEVDAFIADLGDQAKQMSPADLQSRVVDRLIDMKLADNKAVQDKLSQDPVVAQRLYIGQQSTIAELYLDRAARALITDPVLKAKYDELVKQVKPVEEVHARHILVKTEAEAKDIIKQLDKGADFEKLAKEKSTDPGSGESGGDLGYFTKDKMVPEFATVAFSLDKGKYTETPVHTQYGWHVIQVLDKRDQPLPAFDQVKPQLTNLVLQEEVRKVVDDLRKSAKIERFNADGTPMVEPPATAAAPSPATAAAPVPAPAAAPSPAPAAPPAPAATTK